MKVSFCAVIAGVQIALAFGALALGHPAIAGVFAVFAIVQLIGVLGQRCGIGGACETDPIATDRGVPRRATDHS